MSVPVVENTKKTDGNVRMSIRNPEKPDMSAKRAKNLLLLASLSLFVVSLIMPAVDFEKVCRVAPGVALDAAGLWRTPHGPVETIHGYKLFFFGWLPLLIAQVGALGWGANLFYLIAITSSANATGRFKGRTAMAALAISIASLPLTNIFPVVADEGGVCYFSAISPSTGYWFWLFAIATLNAAIAVEKRGPRLILPATGIAITLALIVLIAFAPQSLDVQAARLFEKLCQDAGEEIASTAIKPKSIYFDPDSDIAFEKITNGHVSGLQTRGEMARLILNASSMQYVEIAEVRKPSGSDAIIEKRMRYYRKVRDGHSIDEISSDYGVFQEQLVSQPERWRLGVESRKVVIKRMEDEKVMAMLRFAYNSRDHRFCGPIENGKFSISEFVRRVLGVTNQ